MLQRDCCCTWSNQMLRNKTKQNMEGIECKDVIDGRAYFAEDPAPSVDGQLS